MAMLMVLFTFFSILSHSPQSMQTTVIHLQLKSAALVKSD